MLGVSLPRYYALAVELEQTAQRLKIELLAAQLREEISTLMPNLRTGSGGGSKRRTAGDGGDAIAESLGRRAARHVTRIVESVGLARAAPVRLQRRRRASADFSEAPLPIDRAFRYLLVVRDLASGAQLLALPSEHATGDVVRDALQALFLLHGPPLVLKSDNGSHFVNEEVDGLLEHWGTLVLRSPPGTPQYNGACEAGIGGLKTRAHHESARHGRAGEWTCDDVEVARCLANATARPCGSAAPVPDDAWARQSAIQRDAQRSDFAATVERLREAALDEQVGAETPASPASIERIAITRALVAHGHLHVTRRRVSLPIRQRQTSEIS